MLEIFKSLKGVVEYGDNYEISNLGNVRNAKTGRILKPFSNKSGYNMISLSFKGMGKEKKKLIHRLVALAFIPNPENKPEVNHKDGIKTNNCVSNLEWATSKENQRHAVDLGLQPSSKIEELNCEHLTKDDVTKIKILLSYGTSQVALARAFNTSRTFINRVYLGRMWGDLEVEGFTPATRKDQKRDKKPLTPIREPNKDGNGVRVLTEQDASNIKEMYASGDYSQRELGTIFGVSKNSIANVINGKTWKHIS